MFSELNPQIAVIIETQASGVWVHSWPNRSDAAWLEGRNSCAPSRLNSCRQGRRVIGDQG
jgi:hypothetical protein